MVPVCPLDTGPQLAAEHRALCRAYAAVQARCSELLACQRAEIARLQTQVVQLHAAAVLRTTQAAWLPPGVDSHTLALGPPPAGTVLRLQTTPKVPAAPTAPALPALFSVSGCTPAQPPVPAKLALLEASLQAAELVICQTGCLSHGAYWRDHGHCRRTGTACLLAAAPAFSIPLVPLACP